MGGRARKALMIYRKRTTKVAPLPSSLLKSPISAACLTRRAIRALGRRRRTRSSTTCMAARDIFSLAGAGVDNL